MKTIALLLLCCASACGQRIEYLKIFQQFIGSRPDRYEIRFDFGSKYDSTKAYASALRTKSIVDAIELAERKGWEYVTTYVETTEGNLAGGITNVLMRRKRE